MMSVHEAKTFIGRNCDVTWKDRYGNEQSTRLHIYKLAFVPQYGSFLMSDVDDVYLSKVTKIQPLD